MTRRIEHCKNFVDTNMVSQLSINNVLFYQTMEYDKNIYTLCHDASLPNAGL